jgi:hypothetical protein
MNAIAGPEHKTDSDMPEEIDFSHAMPNKYASRYAKGTNLMLLAPDLMDVFPDSESVNEALRPLAALIRERAKCAAESSDGSAGSEPAGSDA